MHGFSEVKAIGSETRVVAFEASNRQLFPTGRSLTELGVPRPSW